MIFLQVDSQMVVKKFPLLYRIKKLVIMLKQVKNWILSKANPHPLKYYIFMLFTHFIFRLSIYILMIQY